MVLPKAPDDILKHLVFSTTQRHSVHCDRGVKKPENIHILDAGIRSIWTSFSETTIQGAHYKQNSLRHSNAVC